MKLIFGCWKLALNYNFKLETIFKYYFVAGMQYNLSERHQMELMKVQKEFAIEKDDALAKQKKDLEHK